MTTFLLCVIALTTAIMAMTLLFGREITLTILGVVWRWLYQTAAIAISTVWYVAAVVLLGFVAWNIAGLVSGPNGSFSAHFSTFSVFVGIAAVALGLRDAKRQRKRAEQESSTSTPRESWWRWVRREVLMLDGTPTIATDTANPAEVEAESWVKTPPTKTTPPPPSERPVR